VPLWSADGRELYFVQGRDLMAAPVSTAGAFSAGSPRVLFQVPASAMLTTDTSTTYDVAPDGRFLVVRSELSEPMGGHLVVVLNWFQSLQRTLSAGRS
jgi:hypothetical protein